MNQNETGALAQLFEENGYTVVSYEEGADVYIVNSCTVTNFGDQKSRKWLRRAKRENPGAVTVLTGCYPQAFPEEAAKITEADVVTGSGNRHAILADVQKVLDGEQTRVVDIRPHEKGEQFEELPMDKFAEHTRAFVKVEDGCNRRCAYCVIPRARGPVRSRDEASVLEELRRLAEAGYKEVVLTAISLPSYGTDSGTSLVELIEKAAEVPGIERIRLGSLDPDMLHAEDIRRMAAVKKLCPQFHLSLQSGCDKTLRTMRRPYTTAQYADIAAQLRQAFGAENVSFTTDVIVGFPGETEEDFEASMDFVTGMRFLKVHVFPYSRREGTAAFDFPDQLPEHEKEARSHRMTAAVEEVRAAEVAAMQGRTASVLLETPLSNTLFTGYTKQYLPVLVSAPGHKTGDIVEVVLGAWDGKRCRAELL
ncbi:tRNA (N(6)-L-threonylcarbamoyladenosine(37)-C(2))-methylthiotransferase MtaB [Gemmiger formicilis]|nr:tRNA (N(6)-L-threonylcarbamoyladenosine(37)-C(2))-methylthiotransferase MtaB [uncultured Gemmiger sp.]MCI6787517.1 tRNA (N(6)-L-threonylcarbamoyladenosine(37)-C(2))-methylthiotransferase MtaB [Oscillospiraceae bacterium]MCQ5078628.1 tRNA (N(6)-L-threonylcarbamoyladenosine(37)-C(2))-methylthiotransferase MtaB [Gemmiger formicilis]MCQ5114937.1 tRNA (N(6)-L-threonylcarbamoyladenosine(37)-C(2))-methylthiotransferase MtaB [Gemmiger formicilis]